MILKYHNFSPSVFTEIHSHAYEVNSLIYEWGLKKEIISQPNYAKISKLNLGYLASQLYPQASFQDLTIITKYILLSFIFKEKIRSMDIIEQYEDLTEKMTSVFYGNRFSKDPFILALIEWRSDINRYQNNKWQKFFLRHFMNYIYSQYWSIYNKKHYRLPQVNECKVRKRFSEGNGTLLHFINIANGTYSSNVNKKETKTLMTITSDLLNWQKDLLLLEKDLTQGSIHNLVICIHHHEQIPMYQAIEKSVGIRNLQLGKFLKEEKKLLLNNNSSHYSLLTSSLRKIIQGQFDWLISQSNEIKSFINVLN